MNINFAQYSPHSYLHTIFTDSFINHCCGLFIKYENDSKQKSDASEIFEKYMKSVIESFSDNSIFINTDKRVEAYCIFIKLFKDGQEAINKEHSIESDPFYDIIVDAKKNYQEEQLRKKVDKIYDSL